MRGAAGTGIDPETFWSGVEKVVADLTRRTRALARRDELQAQIDKWHRHHVLEPHDPAAYRAFLTEIGYLLPEPDAFTVTTSGVDPEISSTAGPQLVVPVLNARFALQRRQRALGFAVRRAVRHRRDPGTDGAEKGDSYNRVRGDPGDRLRAPVPRRRRGPAGVQVVRPTSPFDQPSPTGSCKPRSRTAPPAWLTRPGSPATRAMPESPRRCCWSTTGCTSRS